MEPNTASATAEPDSPEHRSDTKQFDYSILPGLRGTRSIRLVNLLPGTKISEDAILLEFLPKPVSIENDNIATAFEALSYVWGSVEDVISVGLGVQGTDEYEEINVTKNLAEALFHLRDPIKPRTLWIDAICIDQSTGAEKNHQVRLMGDIYQKANRVVIWLGPQIPGDASPCAIDLIDRTGSDIQYDWLSNRWSFSAGAHSFAYAPKHLWQETSEMIYNKEEGRAIYDLLCREWFRRLWVRQEASLAQDAILQCGYYTTEWRKFASTVRYVQDHWWKTDYRWHWKVEHVSRVAKMLENAGGGDRYDLPSLHKSIRGVNCQDPKDRIYGLLKISHDLFKLDIEPDYSTSASDVYKDVVLKYIHHFQSLDILAAVQPEKNLSHIPLSWIPDWTTECHLVDSWPKLGNYLATDAVFNSGNGELVVSGVVVASSIEDTWPLYRDRSHQEYANNIGKIWAHLQRTSGDDDKEALFQDLCCTLFLGKPTFNSDNALDDATDFLTGRSDAYHWPVATSTAGKTLHRRFFTTKCGRRGVGPDNLRRGDKVAVFLGSATPFIIRPVTDRAYHLVSACYLQGAMSLEPFLGPLPDPNMMLALEDGQVCFQDTLLRGKFDVFEDPRFAKLGIGLQEYRKWLERGQTGQKVSIPKEDWQRAGVNLEPFHLI